MNTTKIVDGFKSIILLPRLSLDDLTLMGKVSVEIRLIFKGYLNVPFKCTKMVPFSSPIKLE
jgi:hypothetical protein